MKRPIPPLSETGLRVNFYLNLGLRRRSKPHAAFILFFAYVAGGRSKSLDIAPSHWILTTAARKTRRKGPSLGNR